MRKNQLRGQRKLICAVLMMIILFGCALMYAVFQMTTSYDMKNINQEADSVMTFLQSSCQKYDDFQLGDSVSELQTMMLQLKNLKNYLENTPINDAQQLEGFINEQYLSGIYILNDNLQVQYHVDREDADASLLLQQIMVETNIWNILTYPQKTYSEQVDINDKTYDYVIAARSDAEGIIICYDDVTVENDDKNEFSLNSLLSGDSFRKNAVIAITDGEKVICSNATGVNGLSVKDCPITNINQANNGYDHVNTEELLSVKYNGNTWYGKHQMYRNYYLYVFYDSQDVFSGRFLILVITAAAYVLACVLLGLILQYIKKRQLQHKEKEYHLINVIASIYTANFAIYPEKNIWKPIVMSERMEKVVGHIPQADKMLETFNQERVAENCREAFGEFVRLSDLQERLADKRFIGYTFEDVEHMWYQILLIPQQKNEVDNFGIYDARVMLVIRDVTEQRQAEMDYQEKLRITAEKAKRANEAKTDFLKRMSHDIRTPINGIRGMVTVGKTCIEDKAKVEDCFEKIKRSSDLLTEFVNNVLDMSKLESGDVVLAEKSFDIIQLLQGIDVFIRASAEEKDVVLNIRPSEVEHTHLIGSPLHIRQVIQNITSNAIKFNRQNGSVTVGCRELSCDGEEAVIELTCADTGVGMSEDFQKKVFDLFSQENSASDARTTHTGTGLGLAIAKRLVDYMHGEISFTSTPGQGTEFKVVLKMKIDKTYYQTVHEEKTPKSIQGMHMLVVEDNELNMEIAEYLLEDAGATVTKAWNGREAVECFAASEEGSFDAVLMDIMMPEMDGLEATRRIRALDRKDAHTVPIIAMSANAFDEDINRSLDAGMNTHIAKPLEFDKLFEAIVQLKA